MVLRVGTFSLIAFVIGCSSATTDGSTSTNGNGSTSGGTTQTVAVVTITPPTLTLAVGATGTLAAQAISASGVAVTGKSVAWASSNTSIATVAAGVVTGVGAGVALITATIDSKSAVVSVTITAPVSPQATFASIAPGGSHTCALNAAGLAFCWGDNLYGQLGNGSQTHALKPTAVSLGIAFASISSGDNHTCGVALSPKGAAYCWGQNSAGQLGDGSKTDRYTPTLVSGGINFFSVSAGNGFTCGLAVDGNAYCWGPSSAELGTGSYQQTSVPVRVASSVPFASIGTGLQHACGLGTDGLAYCWGNGGFLGNGVVSDTAHSRPVAVTGNIKFREFRTTYTGGCGIAQNDQTYCWGGVLGGSVVSPTVVPGGLTFSSLGSGPTANHACGITATRVAYCWGIDTYGQLGDNTSAPIRTSPVAVLGGIAFASIAGGASHSCGLTATGAAYCWGNNDFFQLGIAQSLGNHYTPTPVLSP
jgi:alpha-tubulin suppressor-like RCC1 family protein